VGWAPPTFLQKKEVAAAVAIHIDNVDTDLERSADSDGYIKVQPSGESLVMTRRDERPVLTGFY
jgi:hypothetical protein